MAKDQNPKDPKGFNRPGPERSGQQTATDEPGPQARFAVGQKVSHGYDNTQGINPGTGEIREVKRSTDGKYSYLIKCDNSDTELTLDEGKILDVVQPDADAPATPPVATTPLP